MKARQLILRAVAIFAIASILGGCATATPTPTIPTTAPTTAPTVNQQPTLNALGTQAAQTVIAGLTQNAPSPTPVPPTSVPTATPTLGPTNTPLPPTAAPTATYIPWTLTPAVINTATLAPFSCSITSVSPKATDKIAVSTDFDGVWVVKNTGAKTWVQAETDLKYVSGTKFQTSGDLYDMPSSVASNASITLTIDMKTPTSTGTYVESWAIVQGNITICTLNLTVLVQ